MATDALTREQPVMATLRKIGRRLIGRNGGPSGVGPKLRTPPPAAEARVKALRADDAVREAQSAVDALTASLEQAMRGEGGHFRFRGGRP